MSTPAAPAASTPEVRTILDPGPVISSRDWPEGPVRSLHVVRIGGAGMSAVAQLALEAGMSVTGSDSQDGQFIGPLRAQGARIGIGFSADLLAPGTDLVVVSTAVRADNPEVVAARERGIPVIHRAAALSGLLGARQVIAIAGTHGKTSTTAMATLALRGAGEDPAWALGAAVPDLGRNAGFGAEGRPEAGPEGDGYGVVEADESDGSFLAFAPEVLVVTNLEADHLDFHGTAENVTAAFEALTARIPAGGTLIVCSDDKGARALGEMAERSGVAVQRYGTGPDADWRVLEEDAGTTGTSLVLATPHGELRTSLSVVGHHNVLNALGALAAARAAAPEAALPALAAGLAPFTGASRRFDLAGSENGIAVYDDYAHHPREVEAAVAAARGIVRSTGGRVLVVFQPHLFSRTRAFAAEFAGALAGADAAWVMPVYAAREDHDPDVTARTITALAPEGVRALAEGESGASAVADAARPGDVVLMLGAGDIVETTPSVLAALQDAARG